MLLWNAYLLTSIYFLFIIKRKKVGLQPDLSLKSPRNVLSKKSLTILSIYCFSEFLTRNLLTRKNLMYIHLSSKLKKCLHTYVRIIYVMLHWQLNNSSFNSFNKLKFIVINLLRRGGSHV